MCVGCSRTCALISCQSLTVRTPSPHQASIFVGDGFAIDGVSLCGVSGGASGICIQTLQNDQAGEEGVFHGRAFQDWAFIF
jgi:hypothetical protein